MAMDYTVKNKNQIIKYYKYLRIRGSLGFNSVINKKDIAKHLPLCKIPKP